MTITSTRSPVDIALTRPLLARADLLRCGPLLTRSQVVAGGERA